MASFILPIYYTCQGTGRMLPVEINQDINQGYRHGNKLKEKVNPWPRCVLEGSDATDEYKVAWSDHL